MEQKILSTTKAAVTNLLSLAKAGNSKLWVDYDKKADVLYVNFGRPQKADNAHEDKDGIIKREKKGKIIGLTVLNASRFS